MRIKLFEAFNKDEYYKEISLEEWENCDYTIPFTEEDMKKLKELIEGMEMYPSSIKEYRWSEEGYWLYIELKRGIGVGISLIPDEWYIVNIDNNTNFRGDDLYHRGSSYRKNEYYKCDQFEGILELLKDLHIYE